METSFGSGFGVKHVLRDIAGTEQGLACASLYTMLSVSYDCLYNAEVLLHLCYLYGAPTELSPLVRQWVALIRHAPVPYRHLSFQKSWKVSDA